jgi:hypothetical protein
MERSLRVLGDGLWMLALSIMGAASRMAWKRVKDVLVPMLWSPSGKTLWRAPAPWPWPRSHLRLPAQPVAAGRSAADPATSPNVGDHPAVRARHPGGDLRLVHLSQLFHRALNQLAGRRPDQALTSFAH